MRSLFHDTPMPILAVLCIALGLGGLFVWRRRPAGYDQGVPQLFRAIPLPLASGVLIALGAVVLVMSAGGCSSASSAPSTTEAMSPVSANEPASVSTPGAVQTPASASAASSPVTPAVAESTPEYVVANKQVVVYSNDQGVTVADAFVEVENTGDCDLNLSSARFGVLGEDGIEIVAEDTLIYAAPQVIAPGQRGYFYTPSPIELPGGYFPGYHYTLDAQLTLHKSELGAHVFPIVNAFITEDSDGLETGCGVTNDLTVSCPLVTVYAFVYDNEGNIIGINEENVENLAAGETRSVMVGPFGWQVGASLAITSDYRLVAQALTV